MFCLDPIHPLYNAILDIVAERPGISIADLHEELKKRPDADVTLQHLYRTVSRLMDGQILLKQKGKLTLNLMWVSYLEYFATRAKKQSFEIVNKTQIFPLKEGERKTFTVDTLLEVQTLWNDLLVQLYRAEPQKFLLKYYSHAWWHWCKQSLDANFYRRIKELGVTCFWLYGNETFLDLEASHKYQDLFQTRIATDPPFPTEGYNLNVYGDHIFECIFPEKTTKHFAFLFKTVKDMDHFDIDIFSDVFALREKYTVKVWRNAKQALSLRRKIEQYFLKTAL